MPVTVTRTLNNQSQFAKAALKKGKAKLAPKLQAIADDAVQRAEALVAAELINDRPSSRRHAGTRKMRGSFRAEVIDGGDGTFPFTVKLTSRANEAKVKALEWGSPPHTIEARNADQLWLPSLPGKPPVSNAAIQAYTTKKWPVGPSVEHPGNKPYMFMHRALEAAASAALHRAIRLKRS